MHVIWRVVLSTILIGFLGLGCASDKAAAPVGATSEARVWVQGLSCPLCANGIDRAMMRIPGVHAVTVDLDQGLVRLQHAKSLPPTHQAIEEAVEAGGFTLVRMELE